MTEPALGHGIRGWKSRQMKAERKNVSGLTREDKLRNLEIQQRHRRWEEERAQYVAEQKALGRDPEEALREFDSGVSQASEATIEPEPEPAPEVEESGPETSPEIDGMGRDDLVAEIESYGKKAHPNAKDATLRRKLRGLRDGG